ncbi:MAG: Bax inhibitor-1/YccA family protein [Kiritimatiellia bacterium]
MNAMYDPDALASRSESRTVATNGVFNFVYGWMTVGLAVSGVVAWYCAQAFESGALSTSLMMPATLVELALFFVLIFAFRKLSSLMALALFLAFAAVNGVTLSIYVMAYKLGTLQSVFFITAAMFAGMALYGTVTKRDLSGIGGLCSMALWGIIVAMIVNLFLKSSGMQTVISVIGVLLFVGLTAWDAQKIKQLAEQEATLDRAMVRKLGILCALQLYLDFINLFIFLLQLFGGKGRK